MNNFFKYLLLIILWGLPVFAADMTVVLKDSFNKKIGTVTYTNQGNKVDFAISWSAGVRVSQKVIQDRKTSVSKEVERFQFSIDKNGKRSHVEVVVENDTSPSLPYFIEGANSSTSDSGPRVMVTVKTLEDSSKISAKLPKQFKTLEVANNSKTKDYFDKASGLVSIYLDRVNVYNSFQERILSRLGLTYEQRNEQYTNLLRRELNRVEVYSNYIQASNSTLISSNDYNSTITLANRSIRLSRSTLYNSSSYLMSALFNGERVKNIKSLFNGKSLIFDTKIANEKKLFEHYVASFEKYLDLFDAPVKDLKQKAEVKCNLVMVESSISGQTQYSVGGINQACSNLTDYKNTSYSATEYIAKSVKLKEYKVALKKVDRSTLNYIDALETQAETHFIKGDINTASWGLKVALITADTTLDFTPIIGDIKGIQEGVTGKNLISGEDLDPTDRTIGVISGVIGIVSFGTLGVTTKALLKSSKLGAKFFELNTSISKAFNKAASIFKSTYAKDLFETSKYKNLRKNSPYNTVKEFFKDMEGIADLDEKKGLVRSFNFQKKFSFKILGQDVKVYRWHNNDDDARQLGQFVSTDLIKDPNLARSKLALPDENKTLFLEEYILKKGSKIYEGTVAPLNGHLGGGKQIYIMGNTKQVLRPVRYINE